MLFEIKLDGKVFSIFRIQEAKLNDHLIANGPATATELIEQEFKRLNPDVQYRTFELEPFDPCDRVHLQE